MKRHMVHLIFFILDFGLLWVLFYSIGSLRQVFVSIGMSPFSLYSSKDFILVLALMMILLLYEKIYTYRFDFWEETSRIVKALLLSLGIVLAFLTLSRLDTEYSRSFVIFYFGATILFLPIFKRYTKKLLFKFVYFRKKVKIVGNQEQTKILKEEFKHNWYLGMHYVSIGHDAVFIATKNTPLNELNSLLNTYMKDTKDIYLLPYIDKVNFAKTNMMEYFNIRTSVIHIENELLKVHNVVLKTIVEKSIVFFFLPFIALLHSLIAWFILKDSKGSIFFKQERLGKRNQLFTCYKYRTMYEESEPLLNAYLQEHPEENTYYSKYHKYRNDPRITSFGKFLRRSSLDELPQFLNILKGEMSLVGPRPYMPEEIEKLGSNAHIILMVKPGITGLWQVSGRNNLTFEKRKELDIWYIQNWSLWIDFIILLKTVKVVLGKRGAS